MATTPELQISDTADSDVEIVETPIAVIDLDESSMDIFDEHVAVAENREQEVPDEALVSDSKKIITSLNKTINYASILRSEAPNHIYGEATSSGSSPPQRPPMHFADEQQQKSSNPLQHEITLLPPSEPSKLFL